MIRHIVFFLGIVPILLLGMEALVIIIEHKLYD